MKPSVLILIMLLAPTSAMAVAPTFDYDYLDLGRVSLSPDNGQSSKGPYTDLSYSIFDSVQARASYTRLDYDSTPGGPTAKDYTLGLTGESAVSEGTDVYTDLLYLNERTTTNGVSTTDDGYRLVIGLRHRAFQRLEVDGYLAHNFLDSGSNEVGVGFLFEATSWLSFGASYAHDSLYTNTTTLRVRLYF
ncbi:MAG TPA: hypothetical protein VGO35_12400 [Gammaproteobacteria bacterium]|nr:hypothetical protein [Gammaproteobacteria bacterium]